MILHHAGYGTLLQPAQCIVVSAWCLVSTVLSPGQLLRVEAEGRAEVSWLALDRPREGVQLQDRVAHSVLYCTVLYCAVLYCTVLYCTILYLMNSEGVTCLSTLPPVLYFLMICLARHRHLANRGVKTISLFTIFREGDWSLLKASTFTHTHKI